MNTQQMKSSRLSKGIVDHMVILGKNSMKLLSASLLVLVSGITTAGTVSGHFTKNGTYVQPHYRSAPDGDKSNNYGPSKKSGYSSPYSRDNDKDGISNQNDRDDNNNGLGDNREKNQYKLK